MKQVAVALHKKHILWAFERTQMQIIIDEIKPHAEMIDANHFWLQWIFQIVKRVYVQYTKTYKMHKCIHTPKKKHLACASL